MKIHMHAGQEEEIVAFLRKVEPFNLLDEDAIANIVANSEVREYEKGAYIFRKGDPSMHILFVIIYGIAEITSLNEQDKEIVLSRRREQEFFGETVFLSEENYPASVRAEDSLICLVIPKEIFETLLKETPEFNSVLSRIFAERMRTVYNMVNTEKDYGDISLDQPMRKRVESLMSYPPASCRAEDKIITLAQKMTNNGVSSLIVVEESGQLVGIITEKDLVRMLARESNFERRKASEIMTPNPLTVASDAFYFEALLTMVKHKVKHLVVIKDDKPAGLITIRDLIVSRSMGALSIVNSIEKQENINGLVKASQEIDGVLQALVAEKASSQETLQIVTAFFDRLTRKVIQVCEQEMIVEDYGPVPVSYSWISMGSSGRREQFVKTDQDNGIIFDNVPPDREEEVAGYFKILAEKIVDSLSRLGFAKCKGNVMASNPYWCRSIGAWRKMVTGWINKLDSENVRAMTIFLDFRHIYGEINLSNKLRNYVTRSFQKNAAVLLYLAKDDLSRRVPLNIFKQIVTEKTKDNRSLINLKGVACVHLVDCIRIFSLREGISETNTFSRLNELKKRNVFSKEETFLFKTAFETLMMMRIQLSLKQLNRGESPNNYLNFNDLNRREKALLREAFLAIDRLQNLTGHAFYAFIR